VISQAYGRKVARGLEQREAALEGVKELGSGVAGSAGCLEAVKEHNTLGWYALKSRFVCLSKGA
jgi:hypothetical protein